MNYTTIQKLFGNLQRGFAECEMIFSGARMQVVLISPIPATLLSSILSGIAGTAK